jgi:hypothetical protein
VAKETKYAPSFSLNLYFLLNALISNNHTIILNILKNYKLDSLGTRARRSRQLTKKMLALARGKNKTAKGEQIKKQRKTTTQKHPIFPPSKSPEK